MVCFCVIEIYQRKFLFVGKIYLINVLPCLKKKPLDSAFVSTLMLEVHSFVLVLVVCKAPCKIKRSLKLIIEILLLISLGELKYKPPVSFQYILHH